MRTSSFEIIEGYSKLIQLHTRSTWKASSRTQRPLGLTILRMRTSSHVRARSSLFSAQVLGISNRSTSIRATAANLSTLHGARRVWSVEILVEYEEWLEFCC